MSLPSRLPQMFILPFFYFFLVFPARPVVVYVAAPVPAVVELVSPLKDAAPLLV